MGLAPEFPDEAKSAMFGFLDAWLVERDQAAAMAYFSTTGRSLELVPKAVLLEPEYTRGLSKVEVEAHWREKYWGELGKFGAPHGPPLDEILGSIDPDLLAALESELKVRIVHKHTFTVFVADTDAAIYNFDAGFGDVTTALRPSENLVLVMIADFAERNHSAYIGPFVSFWGADFDGAWRIQALGAVPEGEVWYDGLRTMH